MLAVSNYLPVLHKPRNSCYEILLHNIPRERGEADQCLVPWILFPAFLLKTVMFAFFQPSRLSLTITTLIKPHSALSDGYIPRIRIHNCFEHQSQNNLYSNVILKKNVRGKGLEKACICQNKKASWNNK